MTARRSAWWSLVLLLTAATIAAAALGGWQLTTKHRTPPPADGPAQRTSVQEAASADLPKILGYTYETVEQTLTEATSLMTERFKATFSQTMRDDVIPTAREKQITSQVAVVGTAVEALSSDQATLLVFIDRTITQAGQASLDAGARVRVQLQKQGGVWLVDDITPV